MSDFKVDTLKGKLGGGGARANLFKCTFSGANGLTGDAGDKATHLCKAASLPGSVVGQVDIPFRGRVLKVAGDRSFENWTVTFINDEDFAIRDQFETWMNKINGHENGKGEVDPEKYQSVLTVEQLSRDKTSKGLKKIILDGAFPVNISSIDLSYDTTDAVEEFTVEFAYNYYKTNTTT